MTPNALLRPGVTKQPKPKPCLFQVRCIMLYNASGNVAGQTGATGIPGIPGSLGPTGPKHQGKS